MGNTLKSIYRYLIKKPISAFWNIMEILAGTNYYTARAFNKHRLSRYSRRFSGPPLLIYSMGKVGSQTVLETLKRMKIDMPCYHIHHLTHDYIFSREIKYKKYFHHRDTHYTDFDMLWRLQYLRRKLDNGLNGMKWKIVTLIRDPIAVNVSSFFHQFNEVEFMETEQEYRIKSLYYDFETTVRVQDVGILIELFLNKVDHDIPSLFFEKELKKVFGIDIYSKEFIKSQGYKIYNDELADVLLIKMEKLNYCAEEAFTEYLSLDKFDLVQTNLGSKKPYAHIYKAFKDFVILPDSYVDKMYNSKFVRHFYTEEEINKFKRLWSASKDATIGRII